MIYPKPHLNDFFRTPAVKETRYDKWRLDKNEFLPGWPEEWFSDAFQRIKPADISTHPELGTLYSKIEAVLGFPTDQTLVCAGSDEAIRSVFQVFVSPGDEVIIPHPTYAMYYIYPKIFGARLKQVEYSTGPKMDIQELISAVTEKTRLVCLANPNSPTGTIFLQDEIKELAKACSLAGSVLLVDEAYYPFYESTMVDHVNEFDNLIVTRSFSKAAGLAGLRVGILYTNTKISKLIFSVKPMYEITSISAKLSEYVLDHYTRIFKYAALTREGKEYIASYFKTHDFRVFEGYANFIHVDFGDRKKEIISYLEAHDVLFKEGFDTKSLEGFSRFTVGPVKYMKQFADLFNRMG